MTEIIHIENGYITQHLILSGELRDGDIAVKDWKGNVGDSIDLYNKDWTKKTVIEKEIVNIEQEQVTANSDKEQQQQQQQQEEEQVADVDIKTELKALPEQVLPLYTRTDELMIQLQEIDLASVRAIRAILSGTDTQEDHKTLEALEKRAVNLRKELNTATNK